eukprot:2110359-Rhodomonas_salina.7
MPGGWCRKGRGMVWASFLWEACVCSVHPVLGLSTGAHHHHHHHHHYHASEPGWHTTVTPSSSCCVCHCNHHDRSDVMDMMSTTMVRESQRCPSDSPSMMTPV